MVLAERNAESIRNGKRSRGPSPNGHGSPDSSSEDENDAIPIPAEKIRVGRDYQAVCPELEPLEQRKPDQIADRALLVWSPTIDISDNKLDEYITVAKEKYGYNGEQALGMLFWHKHDLSRAALDLANFTPFPDEWTEEDKVLFDQAFQFHGKSFHRIRQMGMRSGIEREVTLLYHQSHSLIPRLRQVEVGRQYLPDKSIASLVKYYYSWKKIRARTSLMDRGSGGAASGSAPGSKRDGSSDGAGSDHASDKDSDTEEKKWRIHRGIRRGSGSPSPPAPPAVPHPPALPDPKQAVSVGGADDPPGKWCTVCGVRCSQTTQHNAHKMCQACLEHARRTGTVRPLCGPASSRRGTNKQRLKHRLPRGIYINYDDLVAMASGAQDADSEISQTLVNRGDAMLKAMDREIIALMRQVQNNKQQLSSLKRKSIEASATIEDFRSNEPSAKINSRWTNDELLMAVTGVKKYGKDFAAIADTIGTKNEQHVRTFFASYRRRYNLDAVLREHEAEKEEGKVDSQLNGHASNSGEESSAETSSGPSNGTAIQDKMEVDSEGCPLGAPAEQGGAPTTPKPKHNTTSAPNPPSHTHPQAK